MFYHVHCLSSIYYDTIYLAMASYNTYLKLVQEINPLETSVYQNVYAVIYLASVYLQSNSYITSNKETFHQNFLEFLENLEEMFPL